MEHLQLHDRWLVFNMVRALVDRVAQLLLRCHRHHYGPTPQTSYLLIALYAFVFVNVATRLRQWTALWCASPMVIALSQNSNEDNGCVIWEDVVDAGVTRWGIISNATMRDKIGFRQRFVLILTKRKEANELIQLSYTMLNGTWNSIADSDTARTQ